MLMKVNHTEGDLNLLKVAQALRESPSPDDFTMHYYGNPCGTPACALGHYAARQDLQQLLLLTRERVWRAGEWRKEHFIPHLASTGGPIHFDDPRIGEHFEITRLEAFELFWTGGCGSAQTADQAAEYLEGFVARRVATRV